jgi:hypothetical protein
MATVYSFARYEGYPLVEMEITTDVLRASDE